METIQPIRVKPKYVAQVCPNCNGRGTVGYNKRPCPTCGHTNHKGIIFVPAEAVEDGGKDERITVRMD